MDDSQKLKYKLHFEQAVKEGIARDKRNPIWDYEDILLDGPIIDIGCGQSEILLGFAVTDRTLIAFDAEPLQLQWLEQLAQLQLGVNLKNWHFLTGYFPDTPLPAHQYALICFSNLLHFLPLEACMAAVVGLTPYMKEGTQIYIRVHSDNHPQNKDKNQDERYSFFKHYFTTQDIAHLFPSHEYEWLYVTELNSIYNKEDKDFIALWVKEWCHQNGIFDTESVEQAIKDQLADGYHNHITALVRKR